MIRGGRASVAEPSDYRLALRREAAACRLIPQKGDILTSLGMAQYRVGRYCESMPTLTRSNRFESRPFPRGPTPPNLAFLAQGQHQLG